MGFPCRSTCAALALTAIVACSAPAPSRAPGRPSDDSIASSQRGPSAPRPSSVSAPHGDQPLAAAPPAQAEPPPPPAFNEPVVAPGQTRAVVLMYHAFDRGSADLTVDGWQFERQIVWLRENHVEVVSTSQLVAFLRGEISLPEKVAVITIDDGDKSVYGVAWPVLQRQRVPFTLALPTKLMMENKKHRMLTWDQVREMVESGLCEVGSHGHEHKSIYHFSDKQALRELETSRDILERETKQRPVAFFYPLGAFDDRTRALVERAGYRAAFKATGAPVGLDCCHLYAVPRVGIIHRDTVWTIGFYFSPSFMNRMVRLR